MEKIINKYDLICKELYKNWLYFPWNSWTQPKKNHIWTPVGIIQGTEWTDEMRLNGAKALEKIRNIEMEALGFMKRITE